MNPPASIAIPAAGNANPVPAGERGSPSLTSGGGASVLILHLEAHYAGGAERMLAYYADSVARTGRPVALACVPNSPMERLLPSGVPRFGLPDNTRFSLLGLCRQVQSVRRLQRQFPFTVLHGWAARDWELASAAGSWLRCARLGTLHDHPRAAYITPARQRLMQLCSARGLHRTVCVSDAVREACRLAGYPPSRLLTIHNGIPPWSRPRPEGRGGRVRLGFLGTLSRQKGLDLLVDLLDRLPDPAEGGAWECLIGGAVSGSEGKHLQGELESLHATKPWWSRLKWVGWVEDPVAFAAGVDCLIFCSKAFDSFPTVLLEAAAAGTPVLASRVGGVAEIIADGETGWIFDPSDREGAATQLRRLLREPERLVQAGAAACRRFERRFRIERMVSEYSSIYSQLSS